MRQFIAVFMLAVASAVIALASYQHDAPATAAESNDAPLDANPSYTQTKPAPGDGTGTDSGVYFPAVSGNRSEVTGTVQDEQGGGGPQAFIVGSVDAQGHKKFWHSITDKDGHFHFLVPAIAGLVGLEVFKHFNKDSQPDTGSQCHVTDGPVHLPGGTALTNVPPNGPAITEGYSAYEEGGMARASSKCSPAAATRAR